MPRAIAHFVRGSWRPQRSTGSALAAACVAIILGGCGSAAAGIPNAPVTAVPSATPTPVAITLCILAKEAVTAGGDGARAAFSQSAASLSDAADEANQIPKDVQTFLAANSNPPIQVVQLASDALVFVDDANKGDFSSVAKDSANLGNEGLALGTSAKC